MRSVADRSRRGPEPRFAACASDGSGAGRGLAARGSGSRRWAPRRRLRGPMTVAVRAVFPQADLYLCDWHLKRPLDRLPRTLSHDDPGQRAAYEAASPLRQHRDRAPSARRAIHLQQQVRAGAACRTPARSCYSRPAQAPTRSTPPTADPRTYSSRRSRRPHRSRADHRLSPILARASPAWLARHAVYIVGVDSRSRCTTLMSRRFSPGSDCCGGEARRAEP